MAIIDTNYKKYNINKLPRNKYERGNSTSVVKIGGSSSATSSQSNITVDGFVGRYLWGNYFDDTQDISGPLNNVTDINMNGTLTATGPNGYVRATDAYFNHSDIDALDSQTINTYEILANSGNISDLDTDTINNSGKITTNGLEAQSVTAANGNIHTLTSDNIWTKDLTVAGSAHFFELVIDKIKSAGGANLLTPADGFKIQYVDYANYSYANKHRLFFLAENDGKQIYNMWEVGDYAIIQNFNKATTGTSYNIDNTYYWGEVVGVSSEPVKHDTPNDDNLYHYIEVTKVSGEYDGSLTGISSGNECVMLGNKTKPERQTAIYNAAYTPSSGAYDRDLLAPFIIYYEGINPSSNKGFDLSAYKVQWWSSGSRNANVPQNKMVGDFVLTGGDTIKEYIDDQININNISKYVVNCDNNIWVCSTADDYSITQTQLWGSTAKFSNNGTPWTVDLSITGTGAYLRYYGVSGPSSTTDIPISDTYYTIQNTRTTGDHLNIADEIAMNLTSFTDLNGVNNKEIVFKLFSRDNNSNLIEFDHIVTVVKIPKGQDGTATALPVTDYTLAPLKETCVVDKDGVMGIDVSYGLRLMTIDSSGSTNINTLSTITEGYTVQYTDDRQSTGWSTASIDNNTFKIFNNDYLNGTPYQNLNPAQQPKYINVILKNPSGTILDRRTIPVSFLTGHVFSITDEKMRVAYQNSISGAKLYTDGQINTVTNRISSLEVDVTGIRGRVGTLETEYNNLSGVVQTKASTSELNQTANTINARVTSTTETLQNNIDTVDGKFNNYYDKTTTEGLINVSATGVYAGVKEDINGELNETGIDIANKKITINSENTNFLGNINLYNPNEGLILYDEDGNVTVGVLNTNVTNNTNNYNIRNDSKLEAKSQGSTFTYNHTIKLGTYAANDNIDVSYLSAMISQNGSRCSLNSASYSYNLKRGTTSVLTGGGNFTLDDINNAFVRGIILSYQSTALGVYTIELTITYNTANILNGYLSSNISFYCSAKNVSNVQMIGNDGVSFKTGEYRQFVVGSNITLQNGKGNELVLDDRTISKRAINYNSSNNVGLLGEISSTYPYREITVNYTATADDAIIYINGAYTVTLDTSYSGKSYFIISNNDNAKVAARNIRYNGHNEAISEHKLNSFYCYHLVCMAGAYYVIGQCDW